MKLLGTLKKWLKKPGLYGFFARLLTIEVPVSLSYIAIRHSLLDEKNTFWEKTAISITETNFWLLFFVASNIAFGAQLWVNHLTIAETHKSPETKFPQITFSDAAINYAKQLKEDGKYNRVIDLRNSLSHSFHLSGLHIARGKLGEIAYDSAVSNGNELTQASILIDDLGWAVHLCGHSSDAIKNIEKGINILDNLHSDEVHFNVTSKLLKAKAYRHISFITRIQDIRSKNIEKSEIIVNDLKTNESLTPFFKREIDTGQAQILYAKAKFIAQSLNLDSEGKLGTGEKDRITQASDALSLVNQAIEIFRSIPDIDRLPKGLLLSERLNYALGHDRDARKSDAERKDILKRSGVDAQNLGVDALKDIMRA